jgi:hypothetical protein
VIFFSDLFHTQSDMAGITLAFFVIQRDTTTMGFWDTAKKAYYFSYLKDTTYTDFHHSTTIEGIKKDRELYQAMRNWIKSWLDAAPNGRLSGSRSDR